MMTETPIMNRDSVTIKDIEQLELRAEVMDALRELIRQCELPTVFWVNAETDRNRAEPHPVIQNEFWISIRKGTSKGETERLCLSNLYKQIQLKKRCLLAQPTEFTKMNVIPEKDPERFNRMRELIGIINSLSSTIDCSLYLRQYGIETDSEVRKWKYEGTLKGLNEYLLRQMQEPGFCWYRENEASNLMEYAYCASFGEDKKKAFLSRIARVRPYEKSRQYLRLITKTLEAIDDFKMRYDGTNGEQCINAFRKKLVRIYDLGQYISVAPYQAYASRKEQSGKTIHYYSYVPEGATDEERVLFCVRWLNEALGLYKSLVLERFIEGKIIDVNIAVTWDGDKNCYAFGEKEKEYYILISESFIEALFRLVEAQTGSPEEIMSAARYSLFYVALHEYGHILNGDCDSPCEPSSEEHRRREALADQFADDYFYPVLNNQYRNLSIGEHLRKAIDMGAVYNFARQLAHSLRIEETA